jgi:hypothetical protein
MIGVEEGIGEEIRTAGGTRNRSTRDRSTAMNDLSDQFNV